MGKITGFKEFPRLDRSYKPVRERLKAFKEFLLPLDDAELTRQGARCMDCGIPYCHNGCPVNNIIPDWNDLVYRNEWERALEILHSTNNFPEFTGRICPAPCEASCTLNIRDEPVAIKSIECAIIDRGWERGWITPEIPGRRTGKTVAVIGSGPAGLACAQQLARAGHDVTVFEKNARPGGLLRYGIPDFKMEKHLIDRRVSQMQAEGVTFRNNTKVGADIPAKQILQEYDAAVLTGGAEHPRDLPVPGRDLDGVFFAMQFLPQQNRRVGKEKILLLPEISAQGKHVIVIGGGDTGSDCIGTSLRQGAKSVTQLEIMPKPPEKENKAATWPDWPNKMRTSSSQAEGCERDWSIATKQFVGENGKVFQIDCIRLDEKLKEIPGTEFSLPADLVLLAMGFLHPVQDGMLKELGVTLDGRGNVQANVSNYKTSVGKLFSAGDMRRGQSLVVWAIREGRQAARAVDEYLMGESLLPR